MQVWPFKPLSEMIESLEWRTDLMRAKSAEQRIEMRSAPRRIHNLSHMFDHRSYSAARAMVRGAEEFRVPDWTQSVRPGPVPAGSSVFVPFDTAGLDIAQGDEALLWQSVEQFEVVEIETLYSGGVVLAEVTASAHSPRLLPLLDAVAPEGLTAQRPAGRYISASIAMHITSNTDIAASSYAQYRGHDVLPVCPVVADGAFEESVIWPVDPVDNDLGAPVLIRERSIPDEKFVMRWHEFTRPGQRALREWLHSRKGRQKAFWSSTWARDLDVAASIGAMDATIEVFALPGLANLLRSDFDIEIRTRAGVSILRRVTDVQTSAPIDGRAVLALTISPAAGVALDPGEILRVSYLRCARFDADRVELLHRAGAGMSVSVPCVEVPVP